MILGNSHDSMRKASYYSDAAKYWSKIEASNNGMLGGYEQLTKPDVEHSLKFIMEFVDSKRIEFTRCCDCGAGIGRVSLNFLLKLFKTVDLVEQNAAFLESAKSTVFINELASRVDQYIPLGLQEFIPEKERYNLIWCQWVLGHLTDDDLVAFLLRCKAGLVPGGLIGVKENLTVEVDFDDEDSSVTRNDALFKMIFAKAGLRLIKEEVQEGFPKGLYRVKMYMLEVRSQ